MGEISALPSFGVDGEHGQRVGAVDVLRRRFDGRFSVDAFGADPQLQDLIAPVVRRLIPVRVSGATHLPSSGPALFVSNRGSGVLEPTALSVAVRQESGRRLRVVGTPEVPLIGDVLRKFGSINNYPGDLAAVLRAGHLAALPLAVNWLRTGSGVAPTDMLVGALGYSVVPVFVGPGGPFGLAISPWRVMFGAPITVGHIGDRDPLSAAELAEAVRGAVHELA